MNWFKKQINKLFNNEIEDEDYYEEEFEDTRNVESTVESVPEQNQKRTSFRFPLIDDRNNEATSQAHTNLYEKAENNTIKNKNDEAYFYQKGAISKVYDVEVSGIRELLEKRQRIKGNSSVKQSPTQIRKVEKTKMEQRVQKQEIKPTPRGEQKESSLPQVSKRRFVPTNVPSPIYGFNKPSTIDDLLSKKQASDHDKAFQSIGEQKTQEINSEEILDKQAQSEILQTSKEIASSVETIEKEKTSEEIPVQQQKEQEDLSNKIDELIASSINILGTNSIIEIEEENEKTPTVLKEMHYNKVEDIPILIEEIDEDFEETELEQVVEETETELEHVEEETELEQVEEKTETELEHVEEETELEQVEEKTETELEHVEEETETDLQHEEEAKENKLNQTNQEVSNIISTSTIFNEDPVEEILEMAPTENIVEVTEHLNEENVEKKGGILPFNVLMLKSDKEKLAQKQQAQHKDGIKENFRHSDNLEELIHRAESDAHENIQPNNEEEQKDEQIDKFNEEQQHNGLELEPQTTEIENFDEKVSTTVEEVEKKPIKRYVKPSFEFLLPPEEKTQDREWMESQADILVEALSHFQVTAQIESIMQGPAVTQFEITVGHGTKVSKIRNLADDLKLALAAKDIRIQAPIPGKSSIGIEIPNRISRAVRLSEVTDSESFMESESPLEAALGLDLTGKPVTIDLRKMPHGLIAGATGSGKSVCINSLLVSLLYKADPHELKLMLIDPKMVELAPFNHIPHLVSPVITDVKAATAALKWAVEEMERRYQLFAHAGVRDLPRFNKLAESNGDYGHKLPYIVIVIDELADLMMMSPADVEEAICRIAQKARACGIHLIVATQRPSVDVITGLIKSNIPTRIAFAVSSQVDSRTILDSQGAERLLGRGDMLYLGNGMSAPIRLQGTFVTDDEIEEIIEHVRGQGEPDYFFQSDELLKKNEMIEEQDELFEEVCRFVYEQGTASTSSIQRKYHIGYNRAARLIDMLESQGFISEQRGSKPREVYITDSDLSNLFD